MSKKTRLSPGYILFIILMLLLIAAGGFLFAYGSAHNGLPLPTLPGDAMFARLLPHG